MVIIETMTCVPVFKNQILQVTQGKFGAKHSPRNTKSIGEIALQFTRQFADVGKFAGCNELASQHACCMRAITGNRSRQILI